MTGKTASDCGSSLYYPHIHVRDMNWLKSSFLFWDCIVRILPRSYSEGSNARHYTVSDDEKLIRLLVKEGLLSREDPSRYLRNASTKFANKLPILLNAQDGTAEQEDIQDCLVTVVKEGKKAFDLGRDLSFDLYDEKVEDRLKQLLIEYGLAEVKKDQMLYVNSLTGALYMACLASAMSEEMGVPAFTDATPFSTVAQFMGAVHKLPKEKGAVLAQLSIPFPSPDAFNDVSPKQLINFHRATSKYRRQYRDAVREVIQKCGEVGDASAFREENFLREERQKIVEFKKEYESYWKKIVPVGILEVLTASLGTSSLLGQIPGRLPHSFEVAITASMIVGLTRTGFKASTDRQQFEKSPWYYHYQMKRIAKARTARPPKQ